MNKNFIIKQLRETYHEVGNFSFKIILDPNLYKSSHNSHVEFVDSDNNPMKYCVKKWGRKINCDFTIDETVSDGVSSVYIKLEKKDGNMINELIQFWVIK